jgi:hypothetical protein
MFVRFRQAIRRLQCSVIETRRADGKVLHEHVASLGAVPLEASVADRIAFWRALFERVDRLSNRVDADTRLKVFEAIGARIPMPTADEQRQLQRENAEADERVWSSLQDMNASTAAEQRELIAAAERSAATGEAAAKDAGERAARARERLAKLDRGEDVAGGLGKPVNMDEVLRAAGWTDRDLEHARNSHALHSELEARGIDGDFWEALHKRREAADRRTQAEAERDELRRHGLEWND